MNEVAQKSNPVIGEDGTVFPRVNGAVLAEAFRKIFPFTGRKPRGWK